MAEVGVRVDGVDVGVETVTANGTSNEFTVSLPGGFGVNKIVEVINGVQGLSGSDILGTWLKAAGFDKTASVYHPADTQEMDRVLFIGDSITEGGNADNPPLEAGVQLVRAAIGGKVLVNAYGSRALSSISNRATFAALVATWSPSIIWIALGTNDYGLNQGSAATFTTAYADLLDQLHAENPDALIYCQTPLTRGTESANTSGSTMADFRAAISSAAATRTAYCTLVDGTAMLTYPDEFTVDTLHPTTAGQAVYGAAILAELGLS
jgi:lysophospholipase L1-like esterase